jgi:hypothetical protein
MLHDALKGGADQTAATLIPITEPGSIPRMCVSQSIVATPGRFKRDNHRFYSSSEAVKRQLRRHGWP